MERALTPWESAVLAAMASVERPDSDVVWESLPYLIWTGECGCGCASFNVRDQRFPQQPHVLEEFSNAQTPDRSVGLVLWVGEDGRPLSVDVESYGPIIRPDPSTLIVERA